MATGGKEMKMVTSRCISVNGKETKRSQLEGKTPKNFSKVGDTAYSWK